MQLLVMPMQLADHLRPRTLDDERAVSACRVASAWLSGATGLTAWPDPIPDDLWAAALELAVMAYDNLEGLESVTDGWTTMSWGEAPERRDEILASARTKYVAGSAASPMGSFPDAESWPDQAKASSGYWYLP